MLQNKIYSKQFCYCVSVKCTNKAKHVLYYTRMVGNCELDASKDTKQLPFSRIFCEHIIALKTQKLRVFLQICVALYLHILQSLSRVKQCHSTFVESRCLQQREPFFNLNKAVQKLEGEYERGDVYHIIPQSIEKTFRKQHQFQNFPSLLRLYRLNSFVLNLDGSSINEYCHWVVLIKF